MGVICLVYIHIHAAGCEQKLKNPSEVCSKPLTGSADVIQRRRKTHQTCSWQLLFTSCCMHTFCTLLEVFILILSMPSMKDPAVFPIKQDLDSSHETLEHVGGVLRLLCREPWSQDDV